MWEKTYAVCCATELVKGKSRIVQVGISGPCLYSLGNVGDNMLDGPEWGCFRTIAFLYRILEVTKVCGQGAGVLYLYGNYSGAT